MDTHRYLPHPGEIVLVRSEHSNAQLILVTTRHIRRRILRGVLCTNEYEMATQVDALLQRSETGCRFRLLL